MCPLERAYYPDTNSGQNHKAITHAVREVNRLAKMLTGEVRETAYCIKALLVSVLVMEGVANANGRRERGIVSIDLLSDPPTQIHIKFASLTHDAQTVIARQLGTVQAVTPLRERLDADLVGRLRSEFPARRSYAA